MSTSATQVGEAVIGSSQGDDDACIPFCVAVDNPSQANNKGPTIRCTVAFGANKLLLVGQRKYSTHGAHGSDKHIRTRTQVFLTWTDLAQAKGYSIIGIVAAGLGGFASTAVHLRPFTGPTVFVLPHKAGFPLSEAQRSIWHGFVHVGVEPVLPSLHVSLEPNVSLSIALHHFTAWAGYKANSFTGMKYDMEEQQWPGRVGDEEMEDMRRERQHKREADDVVDLGGETVGQEGEEGPGGFIEW